MFPAALLPALAGDTTPPNPGFSWVNLLILVIVAAVAWPLYTRLRDKISRDRKARWAREEQEAQDAQDRFTEDTDPDLRRDQTS